MSIAKPAPATATASAQAHGAACVPVPNAAIAIAPGDHGRPPARLPALQALGAQIFSLFLIIPLALHAAREGLPGAALMFWFALLQGALATALARWRRLPSWWLVIQFAFPLAVVGASAIALPRWIYLAAFLLLLLTYWSTFRTRVPLYNCGPIVWRQVGLLLPAGPLRFLDIGSGLGGIVLHLARSHPEGNFTGIEIAPLPWLVSWLRGLAATGAAGACRFVRGDYGRHDFSQYDVVFAYLSPVAMPALWEKARKEMLPGALLLSLEFAIPGVTPDFCLACGDNDKPGKLLHGFRIPAAPSPSCKTVPKTGHSSLKFSTSQP